MPHLQIPSKDCASNTSGSINSDNENDSEPNQSMSSHSSFGNNHSMNSVNVPIFPVVLPSGSLQLMHHEPTLDAVLVIQVLRKKNPRNSRIMIDLHLISVLHQIHQIWKH